MGRPDGAARFLMEISLTRSQVAAFTLQLSIMIDSGVPLLRALEALTTSGEDGPALLAERVCVQLHRGSSLSAALRNFPRLFDRTFTGSLKVGEKTGCLHLVLANLARDLEHAERERQRLVSSLTYPIALLITTFLMMAFLIYYMLPRFMPFFLASGKPLPGPTRLVMAISGNPLIKIAPLLLGAAFILIWTNRHRQGLIEAWSALVTRLPLFGRVVLMRDLSRVCLQLALQVESGVRLDDALATTARSTSSRRTREALMRVVRGVREGEELATLFQRESDFPPLLWQAVMVGENSGKLAPMLRHVGRMFGEQSMLRLDSVLQLFEPAVMTFMGVVVGSIVLACFLPVYQLATSTL
ncbi:MAG: type II secretion system F family protein [Candidatus Eremiobacteraeota bacterium]|nr:type II secretion system F family protein [Candidatus Eremiobacteraeota bacterium]